MKNYAKITLTVFKKFLYRLIRLPKALTINDQFIISACVITLILGYFKLNPKGIAGPDYGGILIEGLVAQSSAEVDREIEKLTMASLVRVDQNADIQPYLAKSWSKSDDGKKYIFTLADTIQAQSLLDQYNNRDDKLPGVKASIQDEHTIVFELVQPYGSFLDNLTKSYFQEGPYRITKRGGKTVELVANESFILGKPFIPNIIIKIYKSEQQLWQALQKHELTSAISGRPPDASFQTLNLILPKYIFVFFNVKNEPFNQKITRQKLADKKKLDVPISAVITTTNEDEQTVLAQDLINMWETLNAKITLEKLNTNEFKSKVLEKKDYQAAVIGINLGRDKDEYIFWHSSQINNGYNISRFENAAVDKLLEEYRLASDDNLRSQKYDELQKILNDERPAIQLKQTSLKYQVSRQVKGIKVNQGITSSDRFQNVWEWYIKTR